MTSVFLTAEWHRLLMLNFPIAPEALQKHVPKGTELDDWEGTTYVSLVAFLFLDTKVKGLAIPFHRDFEEINLRFYVRSRGPEGWRRGVVFVREERQRRSLELKKASAGSQCRECIVGFRAFQKLLASTRPYGPAAGSQCK